MRLPLARSDHAFGMRMLEEGFRTLHDVQSFRGVRNPARSQNARFSLAHRLAATFPGAGNGMSAMRVLRFASAARAGSGIEAVPLATDDVRVDVRPSSRSAVFRYGQHVRAVERVFTRHNPLVSKSGRLSRVITTRSH